MWKFFFLVEGDNVVDVITVKRAHKEIKVTNPVIVTGNVEEAYLRDEKSKKPGIILLDLNQPLTALLVSSVLINLR